MGGKSRPHRDSIPDRSARSSVAIPTELLGPHYEQLVELPALPLIPTSSEQNIRRSACITTDPETSKQNTR